MKNEPLPQHSDKLCFAIHEGLLLQQRKSRLLALSFSGGKEVAGAGLNYAEALILLMIDSGQDKNVGELSTLLRLERSWVSRIVSSLSKRKLVEIYAPKDDLRSRKVAISKKGQEELSRLMEIRSLVIQKTFSDLNEEEGAKIAELLKAMADSLHAPAYAVSTTTHPIDKELARLSWAFGIVGENFMASGMNVSRYQIFFELARRTGEYVSASDLSYVFPVDLSTVFRSLVSLCEAGLAEKKTSGRDARKQLVRISTKGKTKWEKLRAAAVEIIRRGLEGMQPAEAEMLAELLQKAAANLPGRHRPSVERSVEIRTISRKEAQAFLSQSNFEVPVRADDLEPEGRSFGLFEAGDMKGVVTLETLPHQTVPSVHLAAAELEPTKIFQLLKTAMRVGVS